MDHKYSDPNGPHHYVLIDGETAEELFSLRRLAQGATPVS
jgi:hypothetical protein